MGIFNWTYYFDDNLASMFWGWGYWVVLSLLVLMVVATYIVPGKTKKLPYLQRELILRSVRLASLFGWTTLVWLFFRFEGVRYLSWRLWPAILVLYVLVQIGLMIKFAKIDFPTKRASRISGQEKEKYLKRYLGK
jgi:hypothetical protein